MIVHTEVNLEFKIVTHLLCHLIACIDIEYNKNLDRWRPCFEAELTEGSNLQYKVTNQFDAGDKLYL